jgi:hypothetical protein
MGSESDRLEGGAFITTGLKCQVEVKEELGRRVWEAQNQPGGAKQEKVRWTRQGMIERCEMSEVMRREQG